jgi:hypothetical protein
LASVVRREFAEEVGLLVRGEDAVGPGISALIDALSKSLDAHPGARRAWTLPATRPLPNDVVDDLATVIREHLALDWPPLADRLPL